MASLPPADNGGPKPRTRGRGYALSRHRHVHPTAGIVCTMLAVALSGCATIGGGAAVTDATALHEIRMDRVTLHRELHVPALSARTFIQGGEAVGRGYDRYTAVCEFELRSVRESAQTIRPDDFRVTGMRWGVEQVARLAPVQLASRGLASLDDGGSWFEHHIVRYTLESATQPDVMRLTCRGAEALAHEAMPPTLGEARAALGGVATLHLRTH